MTKPRKIKFISSKWRKTEILLGRSELRAWIPATSWMNKFTLSQYLEKYKFVYIKPDRGSLGIGVMKVEEHVSKDHLEVSYSFQHGKTKKEFLAFDKMYASILEKIGTKKYLVQQGIELHQSEGRPSDLRVMLQKNLQNKWELTGILGRIACPEKIVTNGSQGGKALPLNKMFDAMYDKETLRQLASKMLMIGKLTGEQLEQNVPNIREIGLDIAITPDLDLWILEVNTRPDHRPFLQQKNKRMIQKIIQYGKHNGRKYSFKKTP